MTTYRNVLLAIAFTAAGVFSSPVAFADDLGPIVQPTVLESMVVDHMEIGVDDFDTMMQWYQNVLGFEIEAVWDVSSIGATLSYLKKNGFRIELVKGGSGKRAAPPEDFADHFNRKGFQHLCFTVSSVDAAIAEAEAKGARILSRGKTYDLEGTPYGRRVGFIVDPEGNVIEFGEALFLKAD